MKFDHQATFDIAMTEIGEALADSDSGEQVAFFDAFFSKLNAACENPARVESQLCFVVDCLSPASISSIETMHELIAAKTARGRVMGTNFYWHEKPACEYCGREFAGIHIGKSSAGWCFALHVYPDGDPLIRDLDDWIALWQSGTIRNEYGDAVMPSEMLAHITERSHNGRGWKDSALAQNHARRGPNHLARHAIDCLNCIGHGEGTWDLCVGEFS